MPRLTALLLLAAWPLLTCGRAAPSRPLTVLVPGDVLSLDPNQEMELVTVSVLGNVFEPLVGLSEELRLQTVLAESWENPRPEQWRFHLKSGLRFQDGTPLDARAVRDTLLSVRAGGGLEAGNFLGQVQEITAVDERTLDIVTVAPRALLANLSFLHVTGRNAKGSFPPLVGTGPYRIRSRREGKSLVLETWPGWRGALPEFREAQFVFEPDAAARLAQLTRGEADIATGIPAGLAAKPGAGVRIVRQAGLTVVYLGFNMRRAPGNPFRDGRVRKAFDLALDRRALVQGFLGGNGTVANQPVAPRVFGFSPDLSAPDFDPERARRLLAAAGHSGGFDVVLDVREPRSSLADLVAQALARVGVHVTPRPHARGAFDELVKRGESDLFLTGWNCSSGESGEFYEFLLHTPDSRYGHGNYGAYSSPLVDRVAELNPAVLDQRKRREMLENAAAVVMEELPLLPLVVEDDLYAVREGIEFRPRPDGLVRLADVRRSPR